MTSEQTDPKSAMSTHVHAHHAASDCPNCGTDVSGNFCHECGQETVLHPPSIAEFLHEFIGHYVALEGKLWQTLKLLILKPGMLTVEYMNGRRVRYIQPLRVYLTFSLIFFALFKFTQEGHQFGGTEPGTPAAVHAGKEAGKDTGKDADKDTGKDADKPSAPDRTHVSVDEDGFKELRATHPVVADVGERLANSVMSEDDHRLRTAFFSYAPYAVFALMPVFALLLKLLYVGSGRRYGEHLLFALHANAFAFLMLSVMIGVAPFAKSAADLLFVWLALYLPLAMRRVYGGGRLATFVRWIVLMVLHLLCMVLAISAVVLGAFVH